MRLNHVTLIVSELRRSMNFYRALGLLPIVRAPPSDARADPDGHEIRLYHAAGMRLDPPWKVGVDGPGD